MGIPFTYLASALLLGAGPALAQTVASPPPGGNPIIKNKFTADPAALVQGNTVYLYTGHD